MHSNQANPRVIQKKIAVVGAGLSGMVCASELQKKGWLVTVFEKSRGPSGRSTTKRWDATTGIGIDMGLPYIETAQLKQVANSLVGDWMDARIIQQMPWLKHENQIITTIPVWMCIKKMSQITRYLSDTIPIITQERIIGVHYNGQWALYSNDAEYGGFDAIVFAIPAPQVVDVDGVPHDISSHASRINYCAVNTLLIEMKSPLWFENYYEDVIDGPILRAVIADYLKPNREPQRYTYAVHSQPEWATKQFDELSKDSVQKIMMDALLMQYHRKPNLVMNTWVHQWKYGYLMGPSDSLQCGYLASTLAPAFACGDWCQGPGALNAIESGYLLAHNII
jgi:renalase